MFSEGGKEYIDEPYVLHGDAFLGMDFDARTVFLAELAARGFDCTPLSEFLGEHPAQDIRLTEEDFQKAGRDQGVSKNTATAAWNNLRRPADGFRTATAIANRGEKLDSVQEAALDTSRSLVELSPSLEYVSLVGLSNVIEGNLLGELEGFNPKSKSAQFVTTFYTELGEWLSAVARKNAVE